MSESNTTASQLASLRPGQTGRVTRIEGNAQTQRRLAALGFVPGSPVVALRVAPLRDPVEYRVRGTKISIRRTEASLILIERDAA